MNLTVVDEDLQEKIRRQIQQRCLWTVSLDRVSSDGLKRVIVRLRRDRWCLRSAMIAYLDGVVSEKLK